uniref:RxLR effector protein n=1 Tax=Phytophthora ramorum TaxID=164328 RepID=H3GPC4_PHYRM
MRLPFALLVAAVAALFASGDALSANAKSDLTTLTMTSSKKIQSFAAGQSDGKRFLRSHKNIDFDGEERGIKTSPIVSDMLSDSAYKKEIFKNWLKHNVSSFTARDYMKLDDNWTKEVHNLYNEYARLHKASGQYP